MSTIVRDTAGKFYEVRENPATPQAYLAYPVKKTRNGYKRLRQLRPGDNRLIRKAGTVVVVES